MANQEHIKILEQGVEAWNKWRDDNPDIEPNLSGIVINEILSEEYFTLFGIKRKGVILESINFSNTNLYKANLKEANLSWADLNEANLQGAKLQEADLEWAELYRTNLSGANLQKAKLEKAKLFGANLSGVNLKKASLSGANLSGANLSGANLEEANLYGVNLKKASLKGTNLENAMIGETLFTDIDLSEVKNLDKTRHFAPSSIGIDTIVKSKGKIPEFFLRDCGVPDSFIEYIPSIIQGMNPIEFYSCFISHSSEDKDFARRLHNDLQGKGVRTWFDEKNMRGGKKMHEQIFHNVKVYDKLLLILSDDSMNSSWVKTEIKAAIKDEIKTGKQKLFPIRLVDYKNIEKWEFFYGKIGQDLTDEICEYYIPDFSSWDKDNKKYQKEFKKLLRDIEKGKKKIS